MHTARSLTASRSIRGGGMRAQGMCVPGEGVRVRGGKY